MTTDQVLNQRDKIPPPPFVTLPPTTKDDVWLKRIFQKLATCDLDRKSSILFCEVDLLRKFVVRKGVQLRLEKALMLTRRILTLALRWKENGCWTAFAKFKEGFEWSRVPSRQWSHWLKYLTLRDLLLLSKIKLECKRAVGYWLGLISGAHHPSDSLVILAILSRIWAVSSGIVEEIADRLYPRLCRISSLLRATKAENWLHDMDFPNDLWTWLETMLGFPFTPASIGQVPQKRRRGAVIEEDDEDEEEEDLGEPVPQPSKKAGRKDKSQKLCLDERWTKFFQSFKRKVRTEVGRKQLLCRARKYKKSETNRQIRVKLVKIKTMLVAGKTEELLAFLPKFKKFLNKQLNK